MAPVVHASAEDTETRAMECAVPNVYQSHATDRAGLALMDVDQIGRGNTVKVCS